MHNHREGMRQDLQDRVIRGTFSSQLDSNSEYKYESACWGITQFLCTGPEVQKGFEKLFTRYASLSLETKESFLEAVYAVSPNEHGKEIRTILASERDPKLFSICAAYLFRLDRSVSNANFLKIKMVETFPGYDTLRILKALEDYINFCHQQTGSRTPSLTLLFSHQQYLGTKVIYSFQRWNRSFPGIAIVQNADGHFVRDSSGRLLLFEQLARSGSDLPYFITNGSTPQGVYSLQGTDISHDHLIGPTPNIQMILPFEDSWGKYFHKPVQTVPDSMAMYLQLWPHEWRAYGPIMEAWNAGSIGRNAIIAHGTTIDPEYYRNRPFYPLTPTLGCLCAKEIWNAADGHLLVSDQFGLVAALQQGAGGKGYLYVINLDDQQKPVTKSEIEGIVDGYEKSFAK
jgi:hypothetical protein